MRWLQEWKDEAVANNWKTQHTYSRALRSLKRYPLVLKSGKEAKILEYFGDKICEMLDQRLAKHRRENPGEALDWDEAAASSASDFGSQTSTLDGRDRTDGPSRSNPGKARAPPAAGKGKRSYVPPPRSGPHALLIALLRHSNQEGCTRTELQAAAQPLCDTSFTVPQGDSYYTAWSSMGTLLRKGFVHREGRPHRHKLTDEGRELALRLAAAARGTAAIAVDPSSNGELGEETSPVPDARVVLRDFEVVLLVDCCEATSGPESRRKAEVERELRRLGVDHEVRRLSVGDFAWVAREAGRGGGCPARELMVGPLVERKRTDDLASSIKDGRFREQKLRLKSSGARMVVYLLEEFGTPGTSGLPETTLQQALANTQISDGFLVKVTRNQKDTIAYLTLVTRQLRDSYAGRTLYSCSREEALENPRSDHCLTFAEFNSSSVKNKDLTVREMFGKHLLQLRGVSLEKATCILRKYPTPASLLLSLDEPSEMGRKASELASLKGSNGRNLGIAIGRQLVQLYGGPRVTSS